MGISNENKARKIAKENYEKDILQLTNSCHSEISRVLTRFQNKAFNLAIKHSETINNIKEDIREVKKNRI